MSVGLVALLDDIAALARAAAASIDDVAGMAAKAAGKSAALVIDDTAVTPQYVAGISPKRELPVIWRIARNSLLNKLLLILPVALLLAQFAPLILPPLLMIGGAYLSFEGTEKLLERFVPSLRHHPSEGKDASRGERAIVTQATRTDIILSAEIMVIAMNEVLEESFWMRLVIMVIVAILMTAVVYGAVAILVKLDDIGLAMSRSPQPGRAARGRALAGVMPYVFEAITWIGMVAMLWVGGHLLLVNAAELGFTAPYDFVKGLDHAAATVPGIGPVLGWLVDTACSFIVGFVVGALLVGVFMAIRAGRGGGHGAAGVGAAGAGAAGAGEHPAADRAHTTRAAQAASAQADAQATALGARAPEKTQAPK